MASQGNNRVSVIIPTRNRPRFLEQCIQSVLAQTTPAYETIIVNDGSDSRFFTDIERIASLNDRIHLYTLPSNRGRSYSRNFGLDKATGDYILFLDDDDLLDTQMLATSLPHFQDDKIDVITSFCKVLYLPGSQKGVSYLFDCSEKRVPLSQVKFLEKAPFSCIWRWCPPIHSSLIRKSSLGDVRFLEDLAIGEDWYFWLSLAFTNRKFKCNPQSFVYVRRHHSNTVSRPSWFSGERNPFLNKISQSEMIQRPRDVAMFYLRVFLSSAPMNFSEGFRNFLALLNPRRT